MPRRAQAGTPVQADDHTVITDCADDEIHMYANSSCYFVMLIHRVEGMRIQHFHLSKMPNALRVSDALCRMDVAPLQWDSRKMRATHTSTRTMTKGGVLYIVRFGESRNEAEFRAQRCAQTQQYASPKVASIIISLRDSRTSVRSIQIATCKARDMPRAERGPSMTNLCGKFRLSQSVRINDIAPIAKRVGEFGCVWTLNSAIGYIGMLPDMRTCYVKGVYDYHAMHADIQTLFSEPPNMEVFLLVLVGGIGRHLDVSHTTALLERTVHTQHACLLQPCARTEECSNKLEFSGTYTQTQARYLNRVLGNRTPKILAHRHDASVYCSITRMGEVIFRWSFGSLVAYDTEVHEWMHDVCAAYMAFFQLVLDG